MSHTNITGLEKKTFVWLAISRRGNGSSQEENNLGRTANVNNWKQDVSNWACNFRKTSGVLVLFWDWTITIGKSIFGSLRTYHLPSHSTAFWRPGYWGRQIFWLVRLSERVSVAHTSLSHQQCYGRKKNTSSHFLIFFLLQLNVGHFFATFNFCFKLAWHIDEVDLYGNNHVWTHFHPKVLPPEEHLRQILGLSLNNAYIETGYFPREKNLTYRALVKPKPGIYKISLPSV